MNNRYRSNLLCSTLLVGAAVAAAPVLAQTAPTPAPADSPTPEIIVTGSLVRNPSLISAAPVTVIGAQEITLRQRNTAEQLLRDLPGVVASIGSSVNNGNGGASYVDLRGLGNNRNVVLLDGNRIVPSGTLGRTDLNNIPLALIERLDTLTGGAATTYGADAVSGVVNFITKNDFSGVEFNGSEGITERGDGPTSRIDLTVGTNLDDGRGNVVLSIGYQHADPIYQGDRKYSVNNYTSTSGHAGGSGTTVPARFSNPATFRQINPTTGALVTPVIPFNFNPYNIFYTPFKRYNIYGAGHYELSDKLEVYTRGMFSKNQVNTIIAPSGIFSSVLTIPVSNPFLPAAARAQFCANNDFDPNTPGIQTLTAAQCNAAALATNPADPNFRAFTTTVGRRTTEVGPRISKFITTMFDYRAGMKFNISSHVNLDVSGAYGQSENRQTQQNYVLISRVRSAVYATNTTTCLTGAPNGASITAGTGCVPLNIFGPDGSISANQIPYVTANAGTSTTTSLGQARALLSGDFGYNTPWATSPISFAVGTEYRVYRAGQDADSLSQTAGELGGAGGAATIYNGKYDVKEVYGELNVPLISDKPFIKSLTAEGGIRYSSYKVYAKGDPEFKTTTWKAAGTWEPIDGIKFRGDYQHAVRAPSIAELFAPTVVGLTNLNYDPCAGAAPTTNANLRAVCLAQGAPAFAIGSIQTPNANQPNAYSGGNLGLKPELANSYTLGLVLQPRQLVRGLSLTVDYYHIKITHAITTPTADDSVFSCFGDKVGGGITAASASSPACLAIHRDPNTGALSGDPATTQGLPLALSNLGTLMTDGIDLGANYRHSFGKVKLDLGFQGNYTRRSVFQATPTSTIRSCVGLYGTNCGAPGGSTGSIQPKFSWNQRTTLSVGAVDVSVLWRHIDHMNVEPGVVAFDGTITSGALAGQTVNFGHIPAYNYFDLALRAMVGEHLELTLTVTNLFDKDPPIVGSTIGTTAYNSGNTYPSTYDALGRRYSVGARIKF